MARQNLMTGVLYGAPYIANNPFVEQFTEDTEVFDLEKYLKYRDDLFEKLQKQIGKNRSKQKIKDIERLISISKKQAYNSLGVDLNNEAGFRTILSLLNKNNGLQEKILLWLNQVAEAATHYALKNLKDTDYGDTSLRRDFLYKNFNNYSKKAQQTLDEISIILNDLGSPTSSKELKRIAKELFFGKAGTQTLANTAQSQSGVVGEIGTALIMGINAQLGFSINTAIDQIVQIIGTKGKKADVKVPLEDLEKDFTISVKNISIEKKQAALTDGLSRISVNSGGSFLTFFEDFKKNIDPDIDVSSVIEGFNTYWVNVLYFRNFPLTGAEMTKEFEYTRARMNALLNTYAIVYLMTGYDQLNGDNFFEKIENEIISNKAAIFFSVPGLGTIPFFEILEQIKIGMRVAEDPDVTLRFSTPGAQSGVKAVDRINQAARDARAAKGNAEKHNEYNQNGGYGGTVNVMRGERPQDVIARRYGLYGKAVKTNVELSIKGKSLAKMLEPYV